MAGLECTLDIRQDTNYNLIVNKDRVLDQTFEATVFSGDTEVPFDFTAFSGASLQVRKIPYSGDDIITFDTDDGSIVLGIGGVFELKKTSDEMNNTRAGEWDYNMYLRYDTTGEKRAFLSGNFTIVANVAK